MGELGLARPTEEPRLSPFTSGKLAVACLREEAIVCVTVLILHWQSLCASPGVHLSAPGSSPTGFGHRKEKGPIPEAEEQLVSVVGRLKEEQSGGAVGSVWVWAGACPAGDEWGQKLLERSHFGDLPFLAWMSNTSNPGNNVGKETVNKQWAKLKPVMSRMNIVV